MKMTIDETINHAIDLAEEQEAKMISIGNQLVGSAIGQYRDELSECAEHNRQLAEWLKDLKEAKRLLQAAEKTIDEYCRGYCECCKNRDFELARCGLVNGCRDKDNWEWVLSYRVKELFKEAEND